MGWSGSCNCKASYGVGAHLRIGFVNPVWDTATDTPEMPADPLNGAGGNSKILRDVMILPPKNNNDKYKRNFRKYY